ncbi:MAG: hypothetical protein ACLP6E_15915 [Acidimicrobiales bacterium]
MRDLGHQRTDDNKSNHNDGGGPGTDLDNDDDHHHGPGTDLDHRSQAVTMADPRIRRTRRSGGGRQPRGRRTRAIAPLPEH